MLERILRLTLILAVLAGAYIALWAARRSVKGSANGPPPWRDTKVLVIAAQVATLGVLLTVGDYLWANFRARTDEIGLDLNFDFLDQPSGISIADNPLDPNSSIQNALLAGVKNTFLIFIVGIPLAVLLGTLIGVARLSTNWLLSKIATIYVEFFRNIPTLLVIVFTWQALLLGFPREQDSWLIRGSSTPADSGPPALEGLFIFNNKRFAFPSIAGGENFLAYQVVFLIGMVIAIGVWIWRTRTFNATGTPHRRILWSLATLTVIGVAGYFALSSPFSVSRPIIEQRIASGGIKMQMPYVAVMFGLVLYTASHIAEIVRGSIMSVPKGQVEAGNALALSGFQRYRFVVLPQAFRVAFPPLINQFLNYTKNTSLAIAVGFAETTGVIQNLFGQSRPAPQLLLILMLIYLALSLILSAIGNLINRRLQIVGR
jgi:general L-amino acid transport system permease protein